MPAEKVPRLLGKWDYIGCAIFALLAGLGDHTLLLGAAGIEYAIGRFIGVLVIWGILKMVILRGKRKAPQQVHIDPPPGSHQFTYWRIVWGMASIVAGLACWIIGDGHSIGVNPPIPDGAKLAVTLLGWPLIIDGVRMLIGRRSFMRYVYHYGFYVLCILLLGGLLVWLYESLSLKALVAFGLTAAIALLVFILRELRKSHA